MTVGYLGLQSALVQCHKRNVWHGASSGEICRSLTVGAAGGNFGEYHHIAFQQAPTACPPALLPTWTEKWFELMSFSMAAKSWKYWFNSMITVVRSHIFCHFHRNVGVAVNDLRIKSQNFTTNYFMCAYVWDTSLRLNVFRWPVRSSEVCQPLRPTVNFRSRRIELPQKYPTTKPVNIWVVDYVPVSSINFRQESQKLPVILCSSSGYFSPQCSSYHPAGQLWRRVLPVADITIWW